VIARLRSARLFDSAPRPLHAMLIAADSPSSIERPLLDNMGEVTMDPPLFGGASSGDAGFALAQELLAEQHSTECLAPDAPGSSVPPPGTEDSAAGQFQSSPPEETSPKSKWKQQALSAAAVAGGATLLVLHAPVVAVAAAAGAVLVSKRDDGAGEAARSMGDAGLVAANKAKTFAKEKQLTKPFEEALGKVRAVDAQFGVSETAQAGVSSLWNRVRTVDARYEVSSNAQATVTSSWQALRTFNDKNRVSSRVGEGIVNASQGAAAGAATASSAVGGWVRRLSTSSSSAAR